MKPLPPSQVIAEYLKARKALDGVEPSLIYERGWFLYERSIRYRGSQIIHMTATLNERAKANG